MGVKPWAVQATPEGDAVCIRFSAMASPCEVWIEHVSEPQAAHFAAIAWGEAQRVERTWSRYREGNVVHRINTANGVAVDVDDETARLLDFGALLHQESQGRFDLTAGVLRRVWRFDGRSPLPKPADVAGLMDLVGWHRALWRAPTLRLPAGMEIDLGGIGKEYAVDRTLALLQAEAPAAVLVNFGGDLAANQPRTDGRAWRVGIGNDGQPAPGTPLIRLTKGGIATSGDAHRCIVSNGIRYGHVLDARTGWPVPGAPHTVTVAAATCSQAGALSTLAMLQGSAAETYLDQQCADYHVIR